MRWRRRHADFDDAIYTTLLAGMERMVAAGGSVESAGEAVAQALHQALDDLTPRFVDDLTRRAPRMLRERRRTHRRVRRGIRRHWGKALDLFMMVTVAADESGQAFDRQHRPPDDEWFDPVPDALLGLHARACRVALDVYHLLNDGLPKAALARSRTLHEIAVCAMVIADYSRRPDHADLAERFINHQVVATYKDAVAYQEHCEVLGYARFTDAGMAELEADRDAMAERYGPTYKAPYGWAAGLASPAAPTFRDLERLAEVSHLRSHYAWASHEVHSDAKGWAQNVSEWGDTLYRETSYSNEGLADPSQMALISLNQTTVSLLFSPEDVPPKSLFATKAMTLLLDQASDAFASAEETVERSNRRLQRRQARWGRPYRLWRRLTR